MAPATEVVKITPELKAKLDELKPFDSVTYNDLIADMASEYEADRSEKAAATDGGR